MRSSALRDPDLTRARRRDRVSCARPAHREREGSGLDLLLREIARRACLRNVERGREERKEGQARPGGERGGRRCSEEKRASSGQPAIGAKSVEIAGKGPASHRPRPSRLYQAVGSGPTRAIPAARAGGGPARLLIRQRPARWGPVGRGTAGCSQWDGSRRRRRPPFTRALPVPRAPIGRHGDKRGPKTLTTTTAEEPTARRWLAGWRARRCRHLFRAAVCHQGGRPEHAAGMWPLPSH